MSVNACAQTYIHPLGQAFFLPKIFTSFLALVQSAQVLYYNSLLKMGCFSYVCDIALRFFCAMYVWFCGHHLMSDSYMVFSHLLDGKISVGS